MSLAQAIGTGFRAISEGCRLHHCSRTATTLKSSLWSSVSPERTFFVPHRRRIHFIITTSLSSSLTWPIPSIGHFNITGLFCQAFWVFSRFFISKSSILDFFNSICYIIKAVWKVGYTMFTKMHLKNFRSFGNIELNLEGKRKQPKPLAMVYGENGMGKSNLVCGFATLIELMHTMNVRDVMEMFLSNEQVQKLTNENAQSLFVALSNSLPDIKNISKRSRMVGSEEPVLLEYEFLLDGHRGRYLVELGVEEIIHERLEYIVEKNRGVYFDLTPTKVKLNQRIFKSSEIFREISELVKRYWGKHTLLAILLHERKDKADSYIQDSLSDYFRDVITAFCNVSCYTKPGSSEHEIEVDHIGMLSNFEHGIISKQDEAVLTDMEAALSTFFSSVNSDNRYVFYERVPNGDDNIKYELKICKYIAGKERILNFEMESTGNHQLLRIFRYLIVAMYGGTAIIDEIDTGVHDLLMLKLIKEVYPHIKGQLIFTTHNTALMEMKNIQQFIYIISEDQSANKLVKCIADYETRTFQLNNIRNKYFDGAYSGIPSLEHIDFTSILNVLGKYN